MSKVMSDVTKSFLGQYDTVHSIASANVAMAKQGSSTTVHQINSTLETINGYTGSVRGVKVSTDRVEDRYQAAEVYNLCAMNAKASVVGAYAESIDYICDATSDLSIISKLSKFLTDAKSAADTSGSQAFAQTFLDSSHSLAKTISSFAKQMEGLSSKCDGEILQNISKANDIILSLFDLNKQMTTSENSKVFHDKRDMLLNEMSALFDINVRYGSKGEAFVSFKASGITVLNDNVYTKLSYDVPNPEIYVALPFNPIMGDITATHMCGLTRTPVSDPIVLMSGNIPTKDFAIQEGVLAGLGQLRQQIIPEFLSSADSIASQISFAVNEIYNSGVTIPPKTTLSSTKLVSAQDTTKWGGSIKVAALGLDGLPVTTVNAGISTAIRPLTINLDQMTGSHGSSELRMSDIMGEINAYYQDTITTQRLTLGGLDNIVMVGTSSIRTDGAQANGEFSFQMELDNGSPFDATFNILDVQVFSDDDVTRPATSLNGALPDHFISKAGTYTKTGQNISVNIPMDHVGGAGLATHVTIAVTMQVLKADGTFGQGVATFRIDNPTAGKALTNVRTYGIPSAVAFGASGAVAPLAAYTTTGLITAKITDESGFEITTANTTGKFTLAGTGYSVAIDSLDSKDLGAYGIEGTGCNFGHYLGINNYFVESDTSQARNMRVRDDLAHDPKALSFSRLQQVPKTITKQVNIGQTASVTTAATATLNFGFNPVGANTITIQGIQFTMVVGVPANSQEIQIQGTLAATAIEIKRVLDQYNTTNKAFRDIVTFSIDPATNNLICTAAKAGAGGNAITVATNIAGGWTTTVGGIPVINSGHLDGGYSAQETLTVTNYADQVGTGNREIFKSIAEMLNKPISLKLSSSTTTLGSYVNNILSLIGIRCSDAETLSDSYEAAFTDANMKYQEFFKPNADKSLYDIQELIKVREAMLRMLSFSRENFRALIAATA